MANLHINETLPTSGITLSCLKTPLEHRCHFNDNNSDDDDDDDDDDYNNNILSYSYWPEQFDLFLWDPFELSVVTSDVRWSQFALWTQRLEELYVRIPLSVWK